MRVLWFEVTEPSTYKTGKEPIGGWQDSLERIVRTIPDIELGIAFMSEHNSEVKVVNGVSYFPIYSRWSTFENKFRKHWDVFVEKMLPAAKRIVNEYAPDLIHVFGTEWPFGQIAYHTNVPVVIHIMGSIVPYNNAGFPPGYSYHGLLWHYKWNPRMLYNIWMGEKNRKNWEMWERSTWSIVKNYMGRTQWDNYLSGVMHPNRRYYHVDEALRTDFLLDENRWRMPEGKTIRLVSTGCTSFWKGPDMMLKVARILTALDVDFEWNVVGKMDAFVKAIVEQHEGARFEDYHVKLLGYKQSKELMQILKTSTMYVHTAYIENSPNSICEAQCIGLPIVSTNVGGISTLVRNNVDGVLLPANDPWQMVAAIIELSKDSDRMIKYSENSRHSALMRHDDGKIKEQLLRCYNNMLINLK